MVKNKHIWSLFFFIVPICGLLCASQEAIDLPGDQIDNITLQEAFSQEFMRCQDEFNACIVLFGEKFEANPKSRLRQLLEMRVKTLYTQGLSYAQEFSLKGDLGKAVALLKGFYIKLHEYNDPTRWRSLIAEALPTLARGISNL